MRFAPRLLLLALVAPLAACDKSPPPGASSDKPTAAADPVAKANAGETKPAETKPTPPSPPKPASPPTKTGVLDLEIQEVDGGYKLISPRATQFFTAKPQVQRQDAQTPFGDTIPGAVAIVEGGDRFAGLIYIPIPKDIPYDVKKGLKGARDGMLGMFEGPYDAKDEKAKLGPFDANHMIADGKRGGQAFHVEAWIAYDDVGHTVYGLMSLRMPSDLGGIGTLREGFALRDDAEKPAPKASDAAKKAAAALDPKSL